MSLANCPPTPLLQRGRTTNGNAEKLENELSIPTKGLPGPGTGTSVLFCPYQQAWEGKEGHLGWDTISPAALSPTSTPVWPSPQRGLGKPLLDLFSRTASSAAAVGPTNFHVRVQLEAHRGEGREASWDRLRTGQEWAKEGPWAHTASKRTAESRWWVVAMSSCSGKPHLSQNVEGDGYINYPNLTITQCSVTLCTRNITMHPINYVQLCVNKRI